MEVSQAALKGLLIIKPSVIGDERGYFMENYRETIFDQTPNFKGFVQENESKSSKGVLRGLHLQAPPHGQGKLIRVVNGSILDVVVDIRNDSPTYGQHFSLELTGENKISFFVPEGFAHGFLCLEDDTIVQYKCTAYYNKESEMAIRWNDSDLGIDWTIDNPVISEKDQHSPKFAEFKSPY